MTEPSDLMLAQAIARTGHYRAIEAVTTCILSPTDEDVYLCALERLKGLVRSLNTMREVARQEVDKANERLLGSM